MLITVNATDYTVAFGTTTRTFPIKNPVAPTPTTPTVAITSLLPNPVGDDDEQFETVTVQNKSASAASLVGWTLQDRSGATWNVEGSLAPSQVRAFRRNGQTMSLDNAGDEVVLRDAGNRERDHWRISRPVKARSSRRSTDLPAVASCPSPDGDLGDLGDITSDIRRCRKGL